MADNPIAPTLAPWLTVADGPKAVDFYKRAFGATETYRLEDPGGGLVVRLAIVNAEFWVSSEGVDPTTPSPDNPSSPSPSDSPSPSPSESPSPSPGNSPTPPVGGNTVRLILTVADPDTLFTQAIDAGATVVFPVNESYGWRLGRLADPFGLHWEIGRPLN